MHKKKRKQTSWKSIVHFILVQSNKHKQNFITGKKRKNYKISIHTNTPEPTENTPLDAHGQEKCITAKCIIKPNPLWVSHVYGPNWQVSHAGELIETREQVTQASRRTSANRS